MQLTHAIDPLNVGQLCYDAYQSLGALQAAPAGRRRGATTIATQQPGTFGTLLRRYRVAAGLTQEALAERASLAVRSISDLERGERRAPHRDTVALLAEALQLSAEDRAEFEAAARRPGAPSARHSAGLSAGSSRATPGPLAVGAAPSAPVASVTPARAPEALASGGMWSASSEATTPPLPSHSVAVPPTATVHPALGGAGPLVAAVVAFIRARDTSVSRLVSVLLVGALVGGTLFSTGAAERHVRTGGKLCVATDLPTTGDDVSLGIPLEHAIDLAVQQNRALGDGYTLAAIHYNDAATATGQEDPQLGAQNVTAMVQTPCVLGLVGPVSSRVAAAEMSTAANAGLVMISPANTVPGLTIRLYAADYGLNFDQLHPAGKKTNYFRTIVNDAFQGRELADLTSRQPPTGLGARSAFVVDDHSPYGGVLAGGFTQEFLAKGGKIVGTDGIPFGGTARMAELAELAARIVAARPDVVCYGGTADGGGGLLTAQLAQAGFKGLLVGGDGIADDPAFIDQAGAKAASNVFAINPVPDPSALTAGATANFLRDFHARYPGETPDGYAAYAYDAAMVLITALKHLIRAGQAVTREAVVDQVQDMHYVGVTGPISFDLNGDDAHGIFSLYTVQDGQWVWVVQEDV